MFTLKDLKREKERRGRLRNLQDEKEKRGKVKAGAAAGILEPDVKAGEIDPGSPARSAAVRDPGKKETPLDRWKRTRSRTSGLSAGELANVLDNLTPDGYDREGRKVSFIERGESMTEGPGYKRISEY
jgi:hypothetical protein